MTYDPKIVIDEVLNTFKRQHKGEDGTFSDYTKNLISHLRTLYNRTRRREMHRIPFTLQNLDGVLRNLKPRNTSGGDSLPAQLYRRLPANLNAS